MNYSAYGMTLSLVFLVGVWQSSSLLSCGHVSAPFPILDSSCSKLSALCKALNPHTCCLGRWDTLQPQWSHRKELLHLPFPVHPHFSASSHTTFILNRTILFKGETLNLWSRALLSPLAPWPLNYPLASSVLSSPCSFFFFSVLTWDQINCVLQLNKWVKWNLHDHTQRSDLGFSNKRTSVL